MKGPVTETGMSWFLRRLAISIGLVWVVATIVFLAIHLVPGDPAELLLSQGGVAPDPGAVADLRSQLGLDRRAGSVKPMGRNELWFCGKGVGEQAVRQGILLFEFLCGKRCVADRIRRS